VFKVYKIVFEAFLGQLDSPVPLGRLQSLAVGAGEHLANSFRSLLGQLASPVRLGLAKSRGWSWQTMCYGGPGFILASPVPWEFPEVGAGESPCA